MDELLDNPRTLAAFIAASVAIVLWVLTRLAEALFACQQERAARHGLVRALFAEIDYNARDLEIFIAESPSKEEIRDALDRKPDLVPHVTDARHMAFYRSRTLDLVRLDNGRLTGESGLIPRIVHVYGLLGNIEARVEGISADSFRTISLDGKVRVMVGLKDAAEEAHVASINVMAAMQRVYPRLHLARYDRPGSKADGSGETKDDGLRTDHDTPQWTKRRSAKFP